MELTVTTPPRVINSCFLFLVSCFSPYDLLSDSSFGEVGQSLDQSCQYVSDSANENMTSHSSRHEAAQGCTRLHNAAQCCTRLHKAEQGCASTAQSRNS